MNLIADINYSQWDVWVWVFKIVGDSRVTQYDVWIWTEEVNQSVFTEIFESS